MLNNLRFSTVAVGLLVMLTATVAAQRPRAVTEDKTPTTTATPPPAPATVKAKYEGGVFGFPNKKTGTLTIDATNSRLVFSDGKHKELFSIPFGSITGAYGDSHSVQPAAATVISHVPLYGIPASFVKTKVRYLTIQYDDPDSKAAGITSFKLENKETLDSVLYAVATKAGLTQRGEIYVRKKESN
ncbi:MAG TPA: hypothetical protein VGQ72_03880 [Pyrinomonadaceae bacterium]|jgi:hypothetical protein|nr:hypothetical protein [Pyrinomonadaceae bacterium]